MTTMSTALTTDPETTECLLFDAMVKLKPAAINGALVSLRDLRKWLARELPGAEFDAAVLAADPERFALHHTDYPAGHTAAELATMVEDDEHGGHFIGIALR